MPATMKAKKITKSRSITERELEKARAMAGRKNGVTRAQLAAAAKVSLSRAARILEQSGLSLFRRPLGNGKANRALVFYTFAPI